MAVIRFVLRPQGVIELMRSDRMLADLMRRAEAVAAATSNDELTYEVRHDVGRHRARAAVIAAGARTSAHERAHHNLATTIDHAR